jgi:hypothetical protein
MLPLAKAGKYGAAGAKPQKRQPAPLILPGAKARARAEEPCLHVRAGGSPEPKGFGAAHPHFEATSTTLCSCN